jgi:signal transduction histidine kinase
MDFLNLKKLILQKEIASLINQIIEASHTPLSICDSNAHFIMGSISENFENKHPIECAGKVIGWVTGGDRASFLAAFISYAAFRDFEKRELARETLARYREINLFYNIAEKIATPLNLKNVAQLAIDRALTLIKATSASVMFIDETTNVLQTIAAFGAEYQPKTVLRLGEGIAGDIALKGQAEIVNNVATDPRFIEGSTKIYSLLCAPLKMPDKILGVINLSCTYPHQYIAEDLKLLVALGLQTAFALTNAKLYEDLQRYADELKAYNAQLQNEIIERKHAEDKLLNYQKQLQALASELSLTEERERRQIATDLHDRIGQNLAIAKIKLGSLQAAAAAIGLDKKIEEIWNIIDQTIHDTRSLTFEICPPFLYEMGFEKAIEWLVEETQEQHGIATFFYNDNKPKPLDEVVSILLYQTVRELLINIVKHAHAHTAKVHIKRDNDTIGIQVEDDGIGFNVDAIFNSRQEPGGFGLFSIRERLHYLGGCITFNSAPAHGTKVSLTAPLKTND